MPPLPPWLRAWGAARKFAKRESTWLHKQLELTKTTRRAKDNLNTVRRVSSKEAQKRLKEARQAMISTKKLGTDTLNNTREIAASAAPHVESAVRSGGKLALNYVKENIAHAASEAGKIGLRYIFPWSVLLAFAFGIGFSLPGEVRRGVDDWRRSRQVGQAKPSPPPEPPIEESSPSPKLIKEELS